MPKRDKIHQIVKKALIQSGWQITDDPYVISYGERFLFIDLGAEENDNINEINSRVIGAKQGEKIIAIEIKEFTTPSPIVELEQAIGQYTLYQLLLKQVEPNRELYLAITTKMNEEIFSEPIGQLVIQELNLKLIIIDTNKEKIVQWIN
ncbi:MAG: fatty-acid synthase [Microcystis aeruginosa Ma_SC_T_19800800_S464]|jgi:hypothetical protein|uniref:Fatty-acid synthase n=1 Tax=Microcystis aeruginosa Ma_SC_T_19800800_S464 TaxID=2486257 RepID=A0A552DZK0_MICAE|nr:MAG: fatty-acid synthase [Microcystis aeruginosa Ma_SC_T_19800800_S464]